MLNENKKTNILKEITKEVVEESLSSYTEWKVGVKPNETISNLLYTKATYLYRRSKQLPFSNEEFQKYLNTMFDYRVKQIEGQFVSSVVRSFLVPSDIAYTLSQIGIVKDSDYRKILVPVLSPDIKECDLLDVGQMAEISSHLMILQDLGFSMVSGLPESHIGNLFLMALTFQQGMLVSYSKQDPGFAMFGYIADICNLSVQLDSNHIVKYGLKSSWERVARSLVF